ncbi:L,D-transpeptidase [Streptomyces sp. NPDC050504]|uniref:L,D-transpeptidase n=1 Tax=Streptomyces sp. NPDC050504 TaxID=3365618 RepID=UPI00379E3740
MARSSSGFVAGLTAAALAAVGFLAYQAQASAPDTLGAPKNPRPVPSATKTPKGKPVKDPAVPVESGTGVRVVYALAAKRVWLVGERPGAVRTFPVVPSTVSPAPGTYRVTSRNGPPVTGSDGIRIEHVVRFANVDGTTIGFSAAVDGSLPSPKPGSRTGGVRMAREDGADMWQFATSGTKIVVVP